LHFKQKVIDFGLSKNFDHSSAMTTKAGTVTEKNKQIDLDFKTEFRNLKREKKGINSVVNNRVNEVICYSNSSNNKIILEEFQFKP